MGIAYFLGLQKVLLRKEETDFSPQIQGVQFLPLILDKDLKTKGY